MVHQRDGDPCNRRKPIMTIPTVQDQCPSSWRPGAAHEGLKHIAAFIDQHDVPTMVTGLFFTLVHSSVRQSAIASSSRSRTRRSGFWGLHPILLRMYHAYPGWYVTPNSRAITWATRFRVHKSVGKTAALAPFNRMPSNSFFCSAVSLGERPGWGLARKASSPPCFSRCFQRETEEGETPIKRLTSRTPLPSSNSRQPIMRRISNASALPLGLIAHIKEVFL